MALPTLIDTLRAARAEDWKREQRSARLAQVIALGSVLGLVGLSVLGLLA